MEKAKTISERSKITHFVNKCFKKLLEYKSCLVIMWDMKFVITHYGNHVSSKQTEISSIGG